MEVPLGSREGLARWDAKIMLDYGLTSVSQLNSEFGLAAVSVDSRKPAAENTAVRQAHKNRVNEWFTRLTVGEGLAEAS